MEQPHRYVAQGESSKVCFLRRAIYGLKHSPRAWFAKFNGFSPPLASHHVRPIPLCSLRRLKVVLSFLQFMLMILF